MVWGSMIAWYLFLAGASAGAFLTSAFVEAKYPDSVKMRVAGRIISPIFLGIGLLMLMLDAEAGLHNPLRFFYLIMNPGSVMTLQESSDSATGAMSTSVFSLPLLVASFTSPGRSFASRLPMAALFHCSL